MFKLHLKFDLLLFRSFQPSLMMIIENSTRLVTCYIQINVLAVFGQLSQMFRSCTTPPRDQEQDQNQDQVMWKK